jgi:Tfp pilus assembly protein PilF
MAFGVYWFFITLAIESTIFPIRDVIFEHRLYLPSIGIIIAGICLAQLTIEYINVKPQLKRYLLTIPLFLAISVLSVSTYFRNTVWRNDISLWQDVISKSPRKARPYNMLGVAYYRHGLIPDAINYYKKAIAIDAIDFDAHNNLGIAYLKIGRSNEGTKELKAAFAKGHYELGLNYLSSGRLDEAERELSTAVENMPALGDAHHKLGLIYGEEGKYRAAGEELRLALKYAPDEPALHNDLGKAFAELKLFDAAVHEFREAMRLAPDYAEAHCNLGITYRLMGYYVEAKKEFETAIRIDRRNVLAMDNLKDLLVLEHRQ